MANSPLNISGLDASGGFTAGTAFSSSNLGPFDVFGGSGLLWPQRGGLGSNSLGIAKPGRSLSVRGSAQLQAYIDLYNHTPDGGVTYPLRGMTKYNGGGAEKSAAGSIASLFRLGSLNTTGASSGSPKYTFICGWMGSSSTAYPSLGLMLKCVGGDGYTTQPPTLSIYDQAVAYPNVIDTAFVTPFNNNVWLMWGFSIDSSQNVTYNLYAITQNSDGTFTTPSAALYTRSTGQWSGGATSERYLGIQSYESSGNNWNGNISIILDPNQSASLTAAQATPGNGSFVYAADYVAPPVYGLNDRGMDVSGAKWAYNINPAAAGASNTNDGSLTPGSNGVGPWKDLGALVTAAASGALRGTTVPWVWVSNKQPVPWQLPIRVLRRLYFLGLIAPGGEAVNIVGPVQLLPGHNTHFYLPTTGLDINPPITSPQNTAEPHDLINGQVLITPSHWAKIATGTGGNPDVYISQNTDGLPGLGLMEDLGDGVGPRLAALVLGSTYGYSGYGTTGDNFQGTGGSTAMQAAAIAAIQSAWKNQTPATNGGYAKAFFAYDGVGPSGQVADGSTGGTIMLATSDNAAPNSTGRQISISTSVQGRGGATNPAVECIVTLEAGMSAAVSNLDFAFFMANDTVNGANVSDNAAIRGTWGRQVFNGLGVWGYGYHATEQFIGSLTGGTSTMLAPGTVNESCRQIWNNVVAYGGNTNTIVCTSGVIFSQFASGTPSDTRLLMSNVDFSRPLPFLGGPLSSPSITLGNGMLCHVNDPVPGAFTNVDLDNCKFINSLFGQTIGVLTVRGGQMGLSNFGNSVAVATSALFDSTEISGYFPNGIINTSGGATNFQSGPVTIQNSQLRTLIAANNNLRITSISNTYDWKNTTLSSGGACITALSDSSNTPTWNGTNDVHVMGSHDGTTKIFSGYSAASKTWVDAESAYVPDTFSGSSNYVLSYTPSGGSATNYIVGSIQSFTVAGSAWKVGDVVGLNITYSGGATYAVSITLVSGSGSGSNTSATTIAAGLVAAWNADSTASKFATASNVAGVVTLSGIASGTASTVTAGYLRAASSSGTFAGVSNASAPIIYTGAATSVTNPIASTSVQLPAFTTGATLYYSFDVPLGDYALVGPTGASVGVPFTLNVTGVGGLTGNVYLLASGAGFATPQVITGTIDPSTHAISFTITPTAVGTITLEPFNNQNATDPATFTVSVVAGGGNVITPFGPLTITANNSSFTASSVFALGTGGLISPYLANTSVGQLTFELIAVDANGDTFVAADGAALQAYRKDGGIYPIQPGVTATYADIPMPQSWPNAKIAVKTTAVANQTITVGGDVL